MSNRSPKRIAVGVAVALALTAAWLAFSPRAKVEPEGRPLASSRETQAPLLPARGEQVPPSTKVEPAPVEPGPPIAAAPRSAPSNEASLMAELRRVATTDPIRAVDLARDGNRRFPDSAYAPERTSILIHALVATGHASEARGEAEDMVNRYPDSHWVREIERFTGAHRHRNIEVMPDGSLQYR